MLGMSQALICGVTMQALVMVAARGVPLRYRNRGFDYGTGVARLAEISVSAIGTPHG